MRRQQAVLDLAAVAGAAVVCAGAIGDGGDDVLHPALATVPGGADHEAEVSEARRALAAGRAATLEKQRQRQRRRQQQRRSLQTGSWQWRPGATSWQLRTEGMVVVTAVGADRAVDGTAAGASARAVGAGAAAADAGVELSLIHI